MAPAPVRALQLYGIISLDVSGTTSPVRGVAVVAFRDLGALVTDSVYAAPSRRSLNPSLLFRKNTPELSASIGASLW